MALVEPKRREVLCVALGALLGASRARPAAAEESRSITIVPLGKVPAIEVRTVERALASFYRVAIVVESSRALPRSAFYPPRGRYRAERLLEDLAVHGKPAAFRILGLTNVDISTTKGAVADWGILGLATIDGRVGVLSSFRCRLRPVRSEGGPSRTGRAANADHVAHRLGKTAVHELGHTFGLEHCPNRGCLMEDGKGTVSTTDRECDLCPECRQALQTRGLLVNPPRDPPWPCA